MVKESKLKSKYFYAVGLNYQKADIEIRGKFSLQNNAKESLLKQGKDEGISPLLVISTCNRTEVYGWAKYPDQLVSLLVKHTGGTETEFQKVGYIYRENEAIRHIFRVATGLDSQILGDFEITGQFKQSFALSKKFGLIDNYFERLFNSAIRANKRIKNETEISSGATSVAFASVHYILNKIKNISDKKVLLYGVGKLGRNTCENLVKHTAKHHVTVINRTKEKAEEISGKFNIIVKEHKDLTQEIKESDILIVATGAPIPTINKANLNLHKPLLILDLSIPRNVKPNVLDMEGVELIHLDQLSQITNKTLKKREEHIPKAEEIIKEEKKEFLDWVNSRKYAPTIQALKTKLEEIKKGEIEYQRKKLESFDEDQINLISTRIIQKVTTHFATHFKSEEDNLEESKEWVEKVFQLEIEENA
ncbi:MAG TPA: glutamyl-tRNA reductase [Sphingobacterium sp.]|nr:glutamyl-tRNA reductase [Sphingobacterium sp.]